MDSKREYTGKEKNWRIRVQNMYNVLIYFIYPLTPLWSIIFERRRKEQGVVLVHTHTVVVGNIFEYIQLGVVH